MDYEKVDVFYEANTVDDQPLNYFYPNHEFQQNEYRMDYDEPRYADSYAENSFGNLNFPAQTFENRCFLSGSSSCYDESGDFAGSENRKRKRKRVLNQVQRVEATKREKKRMLKLNVAFEKLRSVLPLPSFTKSKLSRVETLRSAIDYIRSMVDDLSNEHTYQEIDFDLNEYVDFC